MRWESSLASSPVPLLAAFLTSSAGAAPSPAGAPSSPSLFSTSTSMSLSLFTFTMISTPRSSSGLSSPSPHAGLVLGRWTGTPFRLFFGKELVGDGRDCRCGSRRQHRREGEAGRWSRGLPFVSVLILFLFPFVVLFILGELLGQLDRVTQLGDAKGEPCGSRSSTPSAERRTSAAKGIQPLPGQPLAEQHLSVSRAGRLLDLDAPWQGDSRRRRGRAGLV